MAIKIKGTTVINDSADIVNVVDVTASGTACLSGLRYPITDGSPGDFIKSNGSGELSFSGVQSSPYICKIACSDFCSGDPVIFKDSSGATALVAAPGCCCLTVTDGAYTNCFPQNIATDVAIVGFPCSCNCIAIVEIWGGLCTSCNLNCSATSCQCCPAYICVSTTCISPQGSIGPLTCLCCYSLCLCLGWNNCTSIFCANPGCSWISLRSKPLPICSNSGSRTSLLTKRTNCIYTCLACCHVNVDLQLNFCYCTTTCQISIVSCNQCEVVCPAGCVQYTWDWVTPDNCYFISVKSHCYLEGKCCLAVDLPISVVSICDTADYALGSVTANAANCCGCTFRSFVPSVSCCLCIKTTSALCVQYPGMSPFTYGLDGWILTWLDFGDQSQCFQLGCAICYCQKIFAWRPTGNGTYEVTCNAICPSSSTTCIPYFKCCGTCFCCLNFCPTSVCWPPFGCNFSCLPEQRHYARAWDQGDGLKRVIFASMAGSSQMQVRASKYLSLCFKVCSGNLICKIGGNKEAVTNAQGYCVFDCSSRPCLAQNFVDMSSGSSTVHRFGEALRCVSDHQGAGITNDDGALFALSNPICWACNCFKFITASSCNFYIKGCRTSSGQVCNSMFPIATWTGQTNCLSNNTFTWIACMDSANFSIVDSASPCATFPDVLTNAPTHLWAATTTSRFACQPLCASMINYYPHVLHNGNIIAAASNSHFQSNTQMCNCGPSVSIARFLQIHRCCDTPVNTADFLGIAQNTVSTGGTVCVALPGMLDTSLFTCRYFPPSFHPLCCPLTIVGSSGGVANCFTNCWLGGVPCCTWKLYNNGTTLTMHVQRYYDPIRCCFVAFTNLTI